MPHYDRDWVLPCSDMTTRLEQLSKFNKRVVRPKVPQLGELFLLHLRSGVFSEILG